MAEKNKEEIGKVWRGGGGRGSMILAIPKYLAEEYHLDNPTNVIFIPTEHGILIKKLEVVK